MLPLSMTSDDGPTYVNAKQYHGIIRRRQSRAKAVLQNKLIKRNKVCDYDYFSSRKCFTTCELVFFV
jgi:hypothetical protein